MAKFTADAEDTEFNWPWISALIGLMLLGICLAGLVITFTGHTLTAKSGSRNATKAAELPVGWTANREKPRSTLIDERPPKATEPTETAERAKFMGDGFVDYNEVSGIHSSQSTDDARRLRHRNPDSILRSYPTESHLSGREVYDDHSQPTELYSTDLKHDILRYFKSVLQRMVEQSEQSRRAQSLNSLIGYAAFRPQLFKYRSTRGDTAASLAIVLRKLIVNDVFSELDYNGDGAISPTEVELFLRFHEILP